MWPLVFLCVSAVMGAPVNQTQLAARNDSAVGATVNQTQLAAINGSVINITAVASSETLEGLQNDEFVDEGDILIPLDRNAVQSLWPGATVPYVLSPGVSHRVADIHAAFMMISEHTCIRFVPHSTEFNYLNIMDGRGCASYVGCQGGAQRVLFSKTCSVGNLCHELIHALGLHHEHTREDRDHFIDVQWHSIVPGKQKNFKVKHGDTLQLPYDLGSIMHYGQYFFSNDGSPTMLARMEGGDMGQRKRLSQLDVQKLNRMYHCDAWSIGR